MIIFLYGEDEFRSIRKLAEIKTKFLQTCKEGGTLFVFDFSEEKIDAAELITKISSGGLFSQKKLVVVKNILAAKSDSGIVSLADYLKKNKEDKNVILVFWEAGSFDKKNPLAKILPKVGKCQQFEKLLGAKLKSWIAGEVEKAGNGKVSISPAAVDRLAVFVGNDLMLLSKEIEKLVSFKNQGEISEKDVELLVRAKIGTDIFETIDALARGDKKTAVRLLHDHLESGDDPFYLLSMYFYQFRNLLKVKPLAERNMPEREIAQKLKLHPYVVKKGVEQGRNFTCERLKDVYKSLCEIDFQSKTGKVDIELALDKFVAMV